MAYLESGPTQPSVGVEGASVDAIGRYFADSGSGRWLSLDEAAGPVDRVELEQLLAGLDPDTGQPLKSAQGSHRRAARQADARATHPTRTPDAPDRLLSTVEAAERLGVDPSYVRAQTRATAEHHAQPDHVPAPASPLYGTRDGRGWRFTKAEVDRFAAARTPARVVHGYDVTFSVPKSVSLLWAVADSATQQRIESVIDHAVTTGIRYLADHGFWYRERQVPRHAVGFRAAAYRHHTSRALEPQLHDHVVIPNLSTSPDGTVRSVDGRGLFAHVPTARHLAAAELRRGLNRELGIQWGPVSQAMADIDGIPAAAIEAMSTRRHDLLDHAEEHGLHTTFGRRISALATRATKDHSVEWETLETSWRQRLDEHGLNPTLLAQLTNHLPLEPLTPSEADAVLLRAAGLDGVTEAAHVFDRRRVIEWLADEIGERVPTAGILELADRFLDTHGIPLEPDHLGHTRYTTAAAVALERRVLDLHAYGIGRSTATVDAGSVAAAVDALEGRLGHRLGIDQRDAVARLTGSGDQFQAMVGLAGSGKTTVLRATADAWSDAGYRVVGAAPFGAAARQLETSLGVEADTVEGLLAAWRHDLPRVRLDAQTVVIVDEASTISNRQLGQLYRHIHNTGATLRTIGDPHQHRSVDAGGLWAKITTDFEQRTPQLTENRRQNPTHLATVRDALDTYRTGNVRGAVSQLEVDGRLTTTERWDELLDELVAAWQQHREVAVERGDGVSPMIAERNHDRRELNRRAQAVLRDTGVLGEPVRIGREDFHIGEPVVTQTGNRDLMVGGRPLVNGAFGTITTIDHDALTVTFDTGTVPVPRDWVAEPVGPGRGGGLSPAHAVTSHKAEGRTYTAALGLAAPGITNREGLYVTLTRGTHDLQLFTIDTNHLEQATERELPALPDERTPANQLADSITRQTDPPLATQLTPHTPQPTDLDHRPLHLLLELQANTPPGTDTARRIQRTLHARIDHAINKPAGYLTDLLGQRPTNQAAARRWDTTARRIETHRHRNGLTPQHGPLPGTTPIQRATGQAKTIERTMGGPERER